MKLSIIIPTKNEEKYLPILLESIRKQTFKDYEIIVADNNSKDKTKKIAKKFSCKVIGGGLPGRARNRGAKVARGGILLFLDSDTELKTKTFLEKSINEFERRKLDIAVPLMYLRGNKMDRLFFDFWNHLTELFQYSFTPFAGGWCIFVKRSLHREVKGFDEKITLGEDSDYAQRIVRSKLLKIKFKVLKSVKIQVSVRRYEKEGHLKVASQAVGVGLHWALLGKDKKNKVRYKFDIYDK